MEPKKIKGFVWCFVVYAIAAAAAGVAVLLLPDAHPIARAAAADIAATAVVFGFSVAKNNSSLYDPYWSVIPPVIAVAWAFGGDPNLVRALLVIAMVSWWGIRLTHNWARGWPGLHHEDWRYVRLREKNGKFYWIVSFLGIHFFPTVLVFLGCLSLWPALHEPARDLNVLDGIALVVTAGSILIEQVADNQLRAFVLSKPAKGTIMDRGLWGRSRHPNYFGEQGFWVGLALFGLAADPSAYYVLAGPAAMMFLFNAISIPMIEKRNRERRPGWVEHAKKTNWCMPSLRKPG